MGIFSATILAASARRISLTAVAALPLPPRKPQMKTRVNDVKEFHQGLGFLFGLALVWLVVSPAIVTGGAQQTNGTPGSHGETNTIDGKQLPPPAPKFGGGNKEKASGTEAWWPPTVVPSRGGPNISAILAAATGY